MIPYPEEVKSKVNVLLEEAYTIRINNLNKSTELAVEALELSRSLQDKALIGKSLCRLSLFAMIKGEHTSSMRMSEEAITYFEELHDDIGVADAKYNLAGIYYKTDNYHLGLVYLIDCLTIYRRHHDYHNQARVQKSLGTIYEYFGDKKNAVKSYENAIDTARKAGDLNLESNAYNPLSGIYLNQNSFELAMEIIERSIAMKKQTGDTRGMAFALYGRGKVYTRMKQYTAAEKDFKEALKIHEAMGERLGLGMAYYKLGSLYFNMEVFDKAKETINIALKLSETYNIVIIKFKCNYLMYEIYKKENDTRKALTYLEHYLREKEAVINTQTLKVIENYELITKMELIENEAIAQKERFEIVEKKNRAEHIARVKQDFLSTMSHEIRTPLNAVITIASLLREKSDKDDQQLLDALKFAGNNLMFIINDILDFTKLESGKVQLQTRVTDLKILVENIKNTYYELANEKGIDLHLSMDSFLDGIYEIDEIKFSQILGNLITNAIKFTDFGCITIEVEKLESDSDFEVLRFKISDTGTGIDHKHIGEIFESFFQPKTVTTRKQGGSGLGLAIVKRLVELHNSVVHVDSTVGKGSVFYFDLRLKKSAILTKSNVTQSDQLKAKTVLLAEDNLVNAMVAVKLLSNWGINTTHSKNGKEAIEKSKTEVFDFILMDIHMPEMDGFEATKQIRNHDNPNATTPIFALTADITAEFQEEYNPYFNGFLHKPIEIDKLYEALTGIHYEQN